MIDIQGYLAQELPMSATVEDMYAAVLEVEEQLKEIKEAVRERLIQKFEEDPDSIDAFIIKQTSPRKVVQWKNIAEELSPSEELLERYTRFTEPGYRIIRKDNEE